MKRDSFGELYEPQLGLVYQGMRLFEWSTLATSSSRCQRQAEVVMRRNGVPVSGYSTTRRKR